MYSATLLGKFPPNAKRIAIVAYSSANSNVWLPMTTIVTNEITDSVQKAGIAKGHFIFKTTAADAKAFMNCGISTADRGLRSVQIALAKTLGVEKEEVLITSI